MSRIYMITEEQMTQMIYAGVKVALDTVRKENERRDAVAYPTTLETVGFVERENAMDEGYVIGKYISEDEVDCVGMPTQEKGVYPSNTLDEPEKVGTVLDIEELLKEIR